MPLASVLVLSCWPSVSSARVCACAERSDSTWLASRVASRLQTRAVDGRNVVAVICTHGHNDHITVAPELGKTLDAPVFLHPADEMLWREIHPDKEFHSVDDGLVLTAGGIELHALHTPGHSPGSVCWSAPALNAVISGDTLFQGGPGATGRSYSSFPTILESISKKLGTLPDETVVYTGHGDTTTIGGELVHYDEWVARGH